MTENVREEMLKDIRDGYIDAWDDLTIDELFKAIKKEHEEVQQYRAIGTPEECREAVERQKAKKVIKYADGTEHCPACDCDNSCIGYGVCIDCGQKLDWSDEE